MYDGNEKGRIKNGAGRMAQGARNTKGAAVRKRCGAAGEGKRKKGV